MQGSKWGRRIVWTAVNRGLYYGAVIDQAASSWHPRKVGTQAILRIHKPLNNTVHQPFTGRAVGAGSII